MSIKNTLSGGALAFCIGASPALADKIDKKDITSDSPSIVSTTQNNIITVLEKNPNSGLTHELCIYPISSRGDDISEAFLKEFQTINKENGVTSELTGLMKQFRDNTNTLEQKDFIYRKAEHIINTIWGNPDLLFKVGLSLARNNEMFGFTLLRQSLVISKKHHDDMDPIFEKIIDGIEQDGIFTEDLSFMIMTFGPFIRESITQRLNNPKLPEPKRMQFKNALQIIESSP